MRARPPAVVAAIAAALSLASLTACGGDSGDDGADAITSPTGVVCEGRPPATEPAPQTYSAPPTLTINRLATYTATLETSCGEIVAELAPQQAPVAVNNFVFLAREGFYDGLTFHRVVPGFVIQGGDPEGTGMGGPGYSFQDELPDDGYPAGALAMANAGPDTNGSQFFIVTGDASALPNDYTRFGQVTDGLDVAREIESFGEPGGEAPTQTIYLYAVTIAEG